AAPNRDRSSMLNVIDEFTHEALAMTCVSVRVAMLTIAGVTRSNTGAAVTSPRSSSSKAVSPFVGKGRKQRNQKGKKHDQPARAGCM
uniref:hypothetical protein n=1 Tax=Paracoccus sp. TRP TaxID=412597 RepID=UPI000225F026